MPFPFWGVRDIDSVKNENFLPCVSCLNSFLDIRSPKNKKTLYFLNYDKNITSNKLTSFLLENYKGALLFNNCTKKEFIEALISHEQIITNSFHGAYWGLLSGRTVSLIGYSTKFYSLFKSFGLDTSKIIKVTRGVESDLINGLSIANDEYYKNRLDDYEFFKNMFRVKNLAFANAISGSGLITSIKLKPSFKF